MIPSRKTRSRWAAALLVGLFAAAVTGPAIAARDDCNLGMEVVHLTAAHDVAIDSRVAELRRHAAHAVREVRVALAENGVEHAARAAKLDFRGIGPRLALPDLEIELPELELPGLAADLDLPDLDALVFDADWRDAFHDVREACTWPGDGGSPMSVAIAAATSLARLPGQAILLADDLFVGLAKVTTRLLSAAL